MKTPLTNTILLLGALAAITAMVYWGKVNGDAAIALLSAIVGGALNSAGSKSGADAALRTPATEIDPTAGNSR